MIDADLCCRLAAECVEDDTRMTEAPWMSEGFCVYGEYDGTVLLSDLSDESCYGDGPAIARSRNNLPTIAAQLTAAAELAERCKALEAERGRWREEMLRLRDECDSALANCTQLTRARDHWRAARRLAMEAGEVLKAERDAARWADQTRRKVAEAAIEQRDAARAEVERLKAPASVAPSLAPWVCPTCKDPKCGDV